MTEWDPFTTYGSLIGLAGAIVLALMLIGRLQVQRLHVRRLRAALKSCWQSYLEALSASVERLRAIRALLAQQRPSDDIPDLVTACDALYRTIREDLQTIEQQLETLSTASDAEWYDMSIEWFAVPRLRDELATLLQLAHNTLTDARRARIEEEVARALRAELDDTIRRLERDNEQMAERIRVLEAELQGALSGQALSEAEGGPSIDEAAAARLMAELSENVTLEQAEANQAKAQGEVALARRQIEEEEDADRPALEARIAWQEQVMRWWGLVVRIRRQQARLDQATTQATEVSEGADEERMEQISEFQAVEAQNAELRKKIHGLSTENRRLSTELEQFDATKADAEQLRSTLERVEAARKSTERELNNLETMVEKMEADLVKLRQENQRIAVLSRKVEEREQALEQRETMIAELKAEAMQLQKEMIAERQKFKTALESVQAKQEAEVEDQVSMEELEQIQKAYDELQHQFQEARAARVQAEKNEQSAVEKLQQAEKEHQALVERYKTLRQEYQALQTEG